LAADSTIPMTASAAAATIAAPVAPPGSEPRLPAHLPALDGLRGLAIVLTLCHNLSPLQSPSGLPARLLEAALDVGWVGVQLFFVLSGFLITGLLMTSQDRPDYYRSFFGRRVLRIFPLYYAALLLFMVVLPELVTLPPVFETDRQQQIWYWLYLSNFTEPFGLGGESLPHFWSLAVEEQFYLIWPFLVHRRGGQGLLKLCLSVAVVGFVVRVGMVLAGVRTEAIYMFSISRLDALALGASMAVLVRLPGWLPWLLSMRRRMWMFATVLIVGGLFVTHGYPRSRPLGQSLGYLILAVVFALAVLAAACEDTDPTPRRGLVALLRSGPLRTLGKYSYGMYVFHKPLHDLVGVPVLRSWGYLRDDITATLVYVAAGLLATLLVAVASYHLLEKHFLALKARI
jgi:peptidoglycan/LPS O-acetylase OafA/YrhL